MKIFITIDKDTSGDFIATIENVLISMSNDSYFSMFPLSQINHFFYKNIFEISLI
jgi:hypothetical protein